MKRWDCTAGLVGVLVSVTYVVESRASEETDIEELLSEPVVSGASQAAETAGDAPANVVTLTCDDMNRFGMRTLAEAINFLAMGLVTQDPLHAVEIGGRGVLLTADYGNHVLVVVDGHALNEGWDGTSYYEQGLAVPLEIIDHIELILGPGSVLYGGNAMLGVINVVTKRARSFRGLHGVAEGGLSPRQEHGSFTSFKPDDLGRSYRLGAGVGREFQLFGANAEITAQIEYYNQNGPPFSWGPQLATDANGNGTDFGPNTPRGVWGGISHRQYSTQVPAGYARLIAGDFALSVRAATYKRTTPYINGFNQVAGNFDDPSSYERDRWLSADLRYSMSITERFGLLARGYIDGYDYLQNVDSNDVTACAVTVTDQCRMVAIGKSQWAGLELQGTYDWLKNDEFTTMVGVDARVRHVSARTDTFDGDTKLTDDSQGPNQSTDRPVGVYVQQRWNPISILHLNAGARFDHDSRGGSRLSPRTAAVIDLWKGGSAKTIYAEAFRAPTFYEFYYTAPDQVPNPKLQSETVRSAEVAFEQKLGAHRLMFGAFRSWWSNMMQTINIGGDVYQFQNASAIDNYGYNGSVEGKFGDFLYGASLTGAYTRRKTPDGTAPLAVAPQLFGNARLAYDLPANLPTLAVATNLVGPRLADRALDGGFPVVPRSPSTLGLRVTASGNVPTVTGLAYRVSWDYSTGSTVPYVAGPNQFYDPANPRDAELAPVNRMTAFATLRYDIAY